MHIGNMIRQKLKEQGRSVTWFAQQIYCSRSNTYRIFNNPNIDTELLKRICRILDYDFFNDISKDIHNLNKPP